MEHLTVVEANSRSLVTGLDAISLYGISGQGSIDAQEKWVETPEGMRAGEGLGRI